jgi:hypothetical protein
VRELRQCERGLGALWLVLALAVPRVVNGQPPGVDPERQEQQLFNSQVQIPPLKQYSLAFTVQSNLRNARIAGNVQASGGSGNDIRVVVMKGRSIVYDSGRRRSVVLSVDCSEPGQYTLIFDNGFSLASPSSPWIKSLKHLEQRMIWPDN